jgi:hypothetical protein
MVASSVCDGIDLLPWNFTALTSGWDATHVAP